MQCNCTFQELLSKVCQVEGVQYAFCHGIENTECNRFLKRRISALSRFFVMNPRIHWKIIWIDFGKNQISRMHISQSPLIMHYTQAVCCMDGMFLKIHRQGRPIAPPFGNKKISSATSCNAQKYNLSDRSHVSAVTSRQTGCRQTERKRRSVEHWAARVDTPCVKLCLHQWRTLSAYVYDEPATNTDQRQKNVCWRKASVEYIFLVYNGSIRLYYAGNSLQFFVLEFHDVAERKLHLSPFL